MDKGKKQTNNKKQQKPAHKTDKENASKSVS